MKQCWCSKRFNPLKSTYRYNKLFISLKWYHFYSAHTSYTINAGFRRDDETGKKWTGAFTKYFEPWSSSFSMHKVSTNSSNLLSRSLCSQFSKNEAKNAIPIKTKLFSKDLLLYIEIQAAHSLRDTTHNSGRSLNSRLLQYKQVESWKSWICLPIPILSLSAFESLSLNFFFLTSISTRAIEPFLRDAR